MQHVRVSVSLTCCQRNGPRAILQAWHNQCYAKVSAKAVTMLEARGGAFQPFGVPSASALFPSFPMYTRPDAFPDGPPEGFYPPTTPPAEFRNLFIRPLDVDLTWTVLPRHSSCAYAPFCTLAAALCSLSVGHSACCCLSSPSIASRESALFVLGSCRDVPTPSGPIALELLTLLLTLRR